jgi:hypothetical protein
MSNKYQTHITKEAAELVTAFMQEEYLRINQKWGFSFHLATAPVFQDQKERREAVVFMNALQTAINVLQNTATNN